MRKSGKWALVLGLMAAAPGLGQAAPWSRTDEASPPAAAGSKTAAKADNQKKADEIALALRNARLQGYDIEIEYSNGVATLRGRVTDPKQKEKATKVIERISGIQSVNNELALAPKPTASQRLRGDAGGVQQAAVREEAPRRPAAGRRPGPSSSGIEQASFESRGPSRGQIQQVNFEPAAFEAPSGGEVQPAGDDQAMAEQVGAALAAANFDGYDMEVRFRQGQVILTGTVGTMSERAAAERVASQVPGVVGVQNNLRPTKEAMPQAAMMGPQGPMMGPQGPMMGPQGPIHPAAYQAGMMPPGAPMPMGPGVPAPPGYGHPGSGASQAVYNAPYMPEYAWPSYAQYPNSAAVNYPSQYSASAWPYIGPFYPYPQVPLGWRDATLRWDDGQWSLQFNQRTDKWWWFLSPKNW
jgi:osmotically-inducible protein OsmY